MSEAWSRSKEREFRGWDGEGVTNPLTNRHYYIMLSNSDGEIITRQEKDADGNTIQGLTTEEILEFLCGWRKEPKRCIEIWFAFTYDVNMILCDLSREDLQKLWDKGSVWWRGYSIKYVPRKIFNVRGPKRSFQSTDIFPFFQTSFIKALKKWNIQGWERIEAGKLARGEFSTWTLEDIASYNMSEMYLLVTLADALREKLEKRCDLKITSWHGPGAVATSWLKRENAKSHFPDELPDAVAHAYFGGRTDISAVGEFTAHKSDLASAYPAALTRCISFAGATWISAAPDIDDDWGLYEVSWKSDDSLAWGPLPFRLPDGTILYPHVGAGYYWGVEVLSAERAFPGAITRHALTIPNVPKHERTCPLDEPVRRDYRIRARWKNAKPPELAHEALKLVLNSLYGKLAMSPVSDKKEPPFRNVAWAGWITAWTRAKISEVIAEVGSENVLSIATDGMLLRTHNPLATTGNDLGTWQDEGTGKSLIVCPGLYAHFSDAGDVSTYKQRGMPGGINYGWVLRSWGCRTQLDTPGADAAWVETVRFNGMGLVLQSGVPRNQFTPYVRSLSNVAEVGTSKRYTLETPDGWIEHPLALRSIPIQANQFSAPYKKLELTEELENDSPE